MTWHSLSMVDELRDTMPAIFSHPEVASSGGLMSYGISLTDTYRHAGIYTGKILKGIQPADLPVQQAAKLELAINLKTAKRSASRCPDRSSPAPPR